MKISTRYPILMIEDSPEDYQATVRLFRKADVTNPIYRCADGEEALDFLASAAALRRCRTGLPATRDHPARPESPRDGRARGARRDHQGEPEACGSIPVMIPTTSRP